MTAQIATVAFQGIDCRPVDVQVQLANGLPAFTNIRPFTLNLGMSHGTDI